MKKGDIDIAKEKITAILSQYPYYPRATALLAKIYQQKGKKEETEFTMRNLLETNPLSPYVKEMEGLVDTKESTEIQELKKLFETNNPLIAFFKDLYKKIESGEIEKSKENIEKEIMPEHQEKENETLPGPQEIEKEVLKTQAFETKELEEELSQVIVPEKKTQEEEAVNAGEEVKSSSEEHIFKEEKPSDKEEEPSAAETQPVEEKETGESIETALSENIPPSEEPAPQKEELEKNHFDRAFKLLAEKEYEQAIKEFLKALKEEATNY